MTTPRYKDSRQLVGGFDFKHGNHKPSRISARALDSPATTGYEHDHQVSFFKIIKQYEQDFPVLENFFHTPNGGHRHKATAIGLKAAGVKSGVPDILCLVSRRGFTGLAIELKVGRNDLEPEQVLWRARLLREGWCVHTCWSWSEALHLALWYLEIADVRLLREAGDPAIYRSRHGRHDERCGCDLKLAPIVDKHRALCKRR